jgi:hypothetical protein
MGPLADIAGYVIGTSLSPEMWLAAGGVIYYARSPISFFLALVIAALALVALRFAVVTNYHVKSAIFAVLALAVWASIGWGIRALLRWRERARLRALLDQQGA